MLCDCVMLLLQTVLQFPGPVSDLVVSHDKQLLYVACRSGVYCVSLSFLPSRFEPFTQTISVLFKIVAISKISTPFQVSKLRS